MKKLNILNIFYKLRKNIYVIIKMNEIFPEYRFGSDIDIFAYNHEEFVTQLSLILKEYVSGMRTLVIHRYEDNIHLDILLKGKVELRFDVYSRIPRYHKINIKEELFLSVIENAIPLEYSYQGEKFDIFVPSRVDNFLLRYIEYVEYYEVRRDKIKHLDYIIENSEPGERISFFDKLHVYTELSFKPGRNNNKINIKDIKLFFKNGAKKIVKTILKIKKK
jgi:hypothetical protein